MSSEVYCFHGRNFYSIHFRIHLFLLQIQANIKLIPFGLNEVHDEVNSAFYHKDEVGVMAFFTVSLIKFLS